MKRKSVCKNSISEDERWSIYEKLKKESKVIEANKLKIEILDSYKWKKPCHHVSGESK